MREAIVNEGRDRLALVRGDAVWEAKVDQLVVVEQPPESDRARR